MTGGSGEVSSIGRTACCQAWTAVGSFWWRPICAERLAAFRVVIGLIVLLDFGTTFLPGIEVYWGPFGVHDVYRGSNWWHPQDWPWGLFEPGARMPTVRWYALALIAATMCMTVGFLTRLSTAVTWVLLINFHYQNQAILNAGDALLRCALFYLMMMPAGATFGVDARLWTFLGRRSPTEVAPWGLRLAQVQLCIVYLFTAFKKMTPLGAHPSDWLTGEAIARAFRHPLVMRVDWLACLPEWSTALMTWGVFGWELTFPVLVPWRRFRPWVLGIGVIVHVGIAFVMEIGYFSFVILAYYLLFLPDRWFSPMRIKSA